MSSTSLRIPLQQDASGPAASVTRVVVVSDNLVTRLGLHTLLADSDRAAWHGGVASPGQTRATVERLRPDVALVNLRLPVDEWLALVGDLARRAKVLVISGSAEGWFVASTVRAGATSYVLRGELDAERFERVIVQTGAGEPWLSPAVTSTQDELPHVCGLSRREVEVMNQLAQGRSNAEIARALFLSQGTVKNHLHRIMPKLGVRNRAEAIVLWVSWSKGVLA